MKILIISRYPPFPGGRENFVFELANQLSQDNKVLVITPDQEYINRGKLLIHKYPTRKKMLREIIEKFKPDIINSHTFYLSKDALEIARINKIPFCITLHGDQFAIGNKQRQKIVSTVVKLSDFVINVSNNGKNSIIKNIKGIKRNKLYVINNGVNCKTFNKKIKLDNLFYRKEFDIQTNKLIVLTPTRIAPYKGLDFLLDSIIDNRNFFEKNNILFLISIPNYSFSQKENRLFEKITKKIKRFGIFNLIKFVFLRYDEMKKVYSMADIFLLPSEKEQLPISILEAMACEIPIIATKVGGIPELLRDGKSAYLTDFGDGRRLKQGIEKYLVIKNRKGKIQQAFKKVCQKYKIEKITTEYKILYQKYIKK